MSSDETRANVSHIVNDVIRNGTEYTINRSGEPVAVVIPYEKYMALRTALRGYRG